MGLGGAAQMLRRGHIWLLAATAVGLMATEEPLQGTRISGAAICPVPAASRLPALPRGLRRGVSHPQ